jgi:hypothetical protein
MCKCFASKVRLPTIKLCPELESGFSKVYVVTYFVVWFIQGVIPDPEMESLLINIFGRRGHPVRKYWRMMYWMPKFKNISPWPLPNPVPNDSLELAKLALERMNSVDLQSKVSVYQVCYNLIHLLIPTTQIENILKQNYWQYF